MVCKADRWQAATPVKITLASNFGKTIMIRPEQQRILEYRGGKMAVSAVPGSGKTHTLALLAVELLRSRDLSPDAEILVVTFTNSAVDNIRARIRKMLAEANLPDGGYRVYTLHGLAFSIVREHADLAGAEHDFRLDDEISGRGAMPDALNGFINIDAPDFWRSFIPGDLSQARRLQVEESWREATRKIGTEVTRLAKNLRLTPADVQKLIGPADASSFLRIGAAIYQRYQNILTMGGRLDYDDLIWGAIRALDNSDGYRAALGKRYQFILEDEAQDSTPLQEQILGRLSRDHGNWVRVGDPNQAIMTTFTASDVRFFREFARREDVTSLPLSLSGRSAPKIIALANALVDWAVTSHPEPAIRAMALTAAPKIHPTEPGDPQPNPPDAEARIHVQPYADTETEVQKIARHAAEFVLANTSRTCAVLVPTNWMGDKAVEHLGAVEEAWREQGKLAGRQTLYQDQLKNSSNVRDVAMALGQAVRFCAAPTSGAALFDLREALIGIGQLRAGATSDKRLKTLLNSTMLERAMFPSPAAEPILPPNVEISEDEIRQIEHLAQMAQKWVRASMLPVDQLVLTIAQDILAKENDLAIAHSLAVSLRRAAANTPSLQLKDMAEILLDIAYNRQKFMSSALIEAGFEPIPGVITVTTMHKAKGLEWDRVYLLGVDRQEFPHDADADFRGQQWYLGGADPATIARKELERLVSPLPNAQADLEREARLEYIAERLRLLYVGITRAKRELIVSYAKERSGKPGALALAVQEIV